MPDTVPATGNKHERHFTNSPAAHTIIMRQVNKRLHSKSWTIEGAIGDYGDT